MSPAPAFSDQCAAMSRESLLNYRYSLSLRIAGCERRGQDTEPTRQMIETVREEMRKRGML
jgi:hypothetical protein